MSSARTFSPPDAAAAELAATIPVGAGRAASRLRIGTDFDTQRIAFLAAVAAAFGMKKAKLKVELSSRLGAPATAGTRPPAALPPARPG